MFTLPERVHPRVALIILATSLLGFIDAGYLAYMRFQGTPVFCGSSNACAIVNASEYAEVFGIPLSYGGTLFYFTIFALMVIARETGNLRAFQLGTGMTLASLLTSAYLFYVQAVLLQTFCPYCIASTCFSIAMFGASVWAWWKPTGQAA
jgi:uncharacterized membrane protein